jgi:hypothetical protein
MKKPGRGGCHGPAFVDLPYAIWLAAKSQFTRFQNASTYLARALR